MTSVVGATDAADADAREDASPDRDVLGEARIEVPEAEMRLVAAPHVAAGRVKRKLDEVASGLTYGR